MTTAVVSQPMIFPWGGLFEQIMLADWFVHYDDVQMPQGASFIRRVQIKTARGMEWLTVPIVNPHRADIRDVRVDESQPWRGRHLDLMSRAFQGAPFADDAVAIAREAYALQTDKLCEISIHAIERVAAYFGIGRRFTRSSTLSAPGRASERLIGIVQKVGCDRYVTGHGARNYLDHEAFERQALSVEYMKYSCLPYPQLHGEFTPYVTVLDLIANAGRDGVRFLRPETLPWREFVHAGT